MFKNNPWVNYKSAHHKTQTYFDEDGGLRTKEKNKMPKKEATETFLLDEGEYKGKIVENKINNTPQGYEYHETFVKVNADKDPVIKLGLPFAISEKSKLGKVCQKFGAKLEAGKEVDTDEYLKKDMDVIFSIINNKGKDDTEFSNIVPETFRPKKD